MKFRVIIASVMVSVCPISAHAMDADTFYLKAAALKKKGIAAMMSSDLKPVMTEIQTAGKSIKAENAAANAAGKPLYCRQAKANMSQDQLLAEFARIGPARRKTITTRQALRDILIRRYPCS